MERANPEAILPDIHGPLFKTNVDTHLYGRGTTITIIQYKASFDYIKAKNANVNISLNQQEHGFIPPPPLSFIELLHLKRYLYSQLKMLQSFQKCTINWQCNEYLIALG